MVKISLAKPKDIPGMLKVKKVTWLATYPNRKYKIAKKDILAMDFNSPKRVKKELRKLRDGSLRLWLAKMHGKVVGCATAKKYKRINHLWSLYILPEYQNQGLGRQLMAKTLKWFGKQKNIQLAVAIYNIRAIKFYEKFGFKITKPATRSPHLPDGRAMPSLEMVKSFKTAKKD